MGVLERLASDEFEGLLIVRLSNIETTWQDSLRKEMPYMNVARSLKQLKELPKPRLLLIHTNALSKWADRLRKHRWTLIGIDESQDIKDRNTKASRAAAKLRYSSEYALALSGTPIERTPGDLWAQFRFLVPGLLHDKWKDFEAEYYQSIDFEKELKGLFKGSVRFQRKMMQLLIRKRKLPFKESKLPKFLRLIKPYCVRETSDILGGPSLTLIPTEVCLWGKQRQLYEKLEQTSVSETFNLTAPLKVTQRIKLLQISSGFVIDDDEQVHEVGRAKIRCVKSILKREKLPVVIFCNFMPEIAMLVEEFGQQYRCGVIAGFNRKDRSKIVRGFQLGCFDLLICQARSGGTGVDLFRSHVGILYSPPYSSIVYDQLLKRLHRRGQEKDVRFYLLYGKNTVDKPVLTALKNKTSVSRSVLKHLRRKHHGQGSQH